MISSCVHIRVPAGLLSRRPGGLCTNSGGRNLPAAATSERKRSSNYGSERYLWKLWNLARLSPNFAPFCFIAVERKHSAWQGPVTTKRAPRFDQIGGFQMSRRTRIAITVLMWLFASLGFDPLWDGGALASDRELPEGRTGIAAKYPGDRGIGRDERVVFAELFEAPSINAVAERWESVKNRSIMSLSTEVPPHSSDGQSLLMAHVGGQSTGGHLYRRLLPGYEKLHYRFYVKFDRDCWPIHHFFHVGGYFPPTPWPQGGAGQRPRGDERFTTGVEPFGRSWRWDYYSYWMHMRGSPPRGQCWGNSFIHNSALVAERGRWTCVELMMKLNQPDRSDGEMALWIDGKLVSHLGPGFPRGKWVYDKFLPGQGGGGVRWNDEKGGPEPLRFPPDGEPFEGFQWRKRAELKLNFLWVLLYITGAPEGHVSKVWFDNIVVARDYIGPIQPGQ